MPRIKLNGPRVSGDVGRVWYAVIDERRPGNWCVAVYHPKDKPGDAPDSTCACCSEADCMSHLCDEEYIIDTKNFDYLPADYEPPLELTAGAEVIKALEAARTNLRDMAKGSTKKELHEPLETSAQRITMILDDGYDMKSGQRFGPARPNQNAG